MLAGLSMLEALVAGGTVSVRTAWKAAQLWKTASAGPMQVFGIRLGMYPVTRHDGKGFVAASGSVVASPNLTDRLWAMVLDRLEAADAAAHHTAGGVGR